MYKVALFNMNFKSLTRINVTFLKFSIARNGINDIKDKILEL